jgi:hypothetical protein
MMYRARQTDQNLHPALFARGNQEGTVDIFKGSGGTDCSLAVRREKRKLSVNVCCLGRYRIRAGNKEEESITLVTANLTLQFALIVCIYPEGTDGQRLLKVFSLTATPCSTAMSRSTYSAMHV